MFDLSNYPKNSKFFDPDNEKGISKMKDVFKGKINVELVGLKSKMQTIKDVDGKETKTRKGVIKTLLKTLSMTNTLTFCFVKN